MLTETIQPSACHYLFGKEAQELYESQYSSDQVETYLKTLMLVYITFLSRSENDGFPLIDPIALNNQCHIYAYLTGRIKTSYKNKTVEEKFAYSDDNRFLHLAFLLTHSFLKERNLLTGAIQKLALRNEIILPEDKKAFELFVKDHGGVLIIHARKSLNVLFERTIKGLLEAKRDTSPLHTELYHLSLENLHLHCDRIQGNLYTLPKLAGVAYLIEEQIAFVIKTTIFSPTGTAPLPLYRSKEFEEDDRPIIVFEAIASKTDSIDRVRKVAEKCSNFFERKPSRKHRHVDDIKCAFCTSNDGIAKHHLDHFMKATEHINESLYAMATNFMEEVQPEFIPFFKNSKKYPLLNAIFERSLKNIHPLGVSMEHPIGFTVHHVYVDSAKDALSPTMRMHTSPEAYLTQRGFL